MKKNILNNYILSLLETIEQNISAYSKDKKPEYLHGLRVAIKKVNAIYSFSENIFKEKYDATRLKPLFRKAGKVREMYINIQLLRMLPHPPKSLITRLKKEEIILSKQFSKNSSRYIKRVKDFRKRVCLPVFLPEKQIIIKYFRKQRIKAKKILQHKSREVMHRYRKKIKKVLFVYNALPKGMKAVIELKEAKIDKQQKKLGDWHDTYSAINFISTEHFTKQKSEYILKLKATEKSQYNAVLLKLTK